MMAICLVTEIPSLVDITWRSVLGDPLGGDSDVSYSEPDYHPSSDLWSVYLTFPRPLMLSDKDMGEYFRDRDGQWSQETKAAVARHKAGGLDLNDNWALSWRRWSCPGCGRSKNEIFRLSKRGILLAKLELHHDHMADVIWPRAEEVFGKDWRDTAAAGSGEVLHTIRELVTRFSECLLCSECNAADGKVKGRYRNEIDSRFTFTAPEIGRFVRARANHDHEVDFDGAFKIWKSQEGAFMTRVNLVETLLANLGAGSLERERQGSTGARPMWMALGSSELLWTAFYQEAKDSERSSLLSGLRGEFLARSTRRDSAALPRQSSPTAGLGPTDVDYENYIDPVSVKRWLATPENWACPVCGRSKREILRMSNRGKWSGGIREHLEFIDEVDADIIDRRRQLFPSFRNEYWVATVQTVHVCTDCSMIDSQLGQSDLSLRGAYLKLQDMRDCLSESGAHRSHVIDVDLARQRIARNDAYWSAREALRAFESKLSGFRHKMDWWSRNGIARSEIIADLCEDLRVCHRINETDEQEALVTWLLEHVQNAPADANDN
jgi:rubredoxin